MALSVYKKDGLYYLNGAIVPVNSYRCVIDPIGGNDYISVENISQRTNVINRVIITAIKKENGNYYADVAEFITDVGGLFSASPTTNITGFATSALQVTGNVSLDSIDAKLTTILTQQIDGTQYTNLYDIVNGTSALITDNRELVVYDQVGAALLVGGTQKTQLVDDTNTPLNLATSAKQDLLLTELQLKADLTETQPVSIDHNSMLVMLIQKLIDEQKLTNKLLTKIYQ